jgi:hypothetical protein
VGLLRVLLKRLLDFEYANVIKLFNLNVCDFIYLSFINGVRG